MSSVARLVSELVGKVAQTESATASRTASTVLRDFSRYAEGDQVLLNGRKLSSPLKRDKTSPAPSKDGTVVQHNDIIGKPLSTLRLPGQGNRYVAVQYPTLDQYISLTRRNVTPIYGTYANTIVSLLDLHTTLPSPEASQETPATRPIEILEAGTGHGSLTIHLARAIAASNPAPPLTPLPRGRHNKQPPPAPTPAEEEAPPNTTTEDIPPPISPEWTSYLSSRSAIIHTIEAVPQNSTSAERLIRHFRQGLYWPHIDFHVGSVADWLASQLSQRPAITGGFLSHAILDMPGVETMIPLTVQAMREDAKLMVFCPSITQIADCQKLIHLEGVPLVFEKAVELGDGISSGRVWDVRVVTPRKVLAEKRRAAEEGSEVSDDGEEEGSGVSEGETAADTSVASASEELKFVCRPKVGETTFGGGFLGLWRKSTFRKQDQ